MTLDRSATLADFAVSRLARLYPVYWVAILVTFLVCRWTGAPGVQGLPGVLVSGRDALLSVTMAPSAFGAIPVIGIVWTLTIELFFYMIVGSINALGWRKFLIPILSVLVLAGMADQQWPLATAFPHGGFRVHLMLILGWWPMFLFGIVIYETRSGWKPRHSWAVACCLAAVFFVGWQYGLVRCAMAGAVFSATRYRIQWLTVKPILYLGTISYPLYLIHPGVGFSIMSYMLRRGYSPYATELIALAASIGSASVLCFAVERPSNLMIRGAWNRRKIRLHAESSRAVAASAK